MADIVFDRATVHLSRREAFLIRRGLEALITYGVYTSDEDVDEVRTLDNELYVE